MKKWAYYNECDPFAAAWLRNLIAAGHIAPGEVDERKIQDVEAFEISSFLQCHFFAGIGVWSYALRQAGWSDDGPEIWTGSCPCQPFSAAGKQKGFADERHLWPTWFGLIDQCRPPVVVGEQVASKDGLGWADLVSSDMEGAGYAFGASDLCAAGFGGAHIRQRLYFVGMADSIDQGSQGRIHRWSDAGRESFDGHARRDGATGGMGNSGEQSSERDSREIHGAQTVGASPRNSDGRHDQRCADASATGGMANPECDGWRSDEPGRGSNQRIAVGRGSQGCAAIGLADSLPTGRSERGTIAGIRQTAGSSASSRLADADECPDERKLAQSGVGAVTQAIRSDEERSIRNSREAGSLDDADWLLCRNPAGEPSWRPVESLTFPLAHGIAGRVGRLRAYGNALDAKTAQGFCEVVKEIVDDLRPVKEFDL